MPARSDPMSDALQASAQDFIGKEGGMLTGLLGLVTYLDKDGNRMWAVAVPSNQPIHVSLGISKLIQMTVEGTAAGAMYAGPQPPEGP